MLPDASADQPSSSESAKRAAQVQPAPAMTSDGTTYVEVDIDVMASELQPTVAVAEGIAVVPESSDQATQALELAAVRAELRRVMRDQEELQRSLRLRDGWLQGLREELDTAQSQLHTVRGELNDARAHVTELTASVAEKQGRIAALESEVQRLHAHTRTAIPEELLPRPMAPTERMSHVHTLVPVDHDAEAIQLNRKVMTIGRTSESDICVPSFLVSRDHARLLVNPSGVTLFDVGSVNGCYVNDERVKKQVLREGDLVRIADRCYRFTAADEARRCA
jgi:hypothetical protein